MTNRFRYTQWDGSQQIDPLDPDELLDLLADDLLDEASLRQALDRLMMRGGMRQDGNRLQGLRDLLDRLRAQRDQQLGQYNLNSFMEDIAQRLDDIVDSERGGIERRLQESRESDAPQQMRDMLDQLANRKQQF